jgi:hypothetical protein
MLFGAFVINVEISTNRLIPYLSEDQDSSYYLGRSVLHRLEFERF